MKPRIGFGFDVHRLVQNRELWLGGIKIPHTLGLLGHSDADVALHALIDALLGAAALRDIGYHFPDSDERYRGADSKELLKAEDTDSHRFVPGAEEYILQTEKSHSHDAGMYSLMSRHFRERCIGKSHHYRTLGIHRTRRRHSRLRYRPDFRGLRHNNATPSFLLKNTRHLF